jgi:lipoprotein NlpD
MITRKSIVLYLLIIVMASACGSTTSLVKRNQDKQLPAETDVEVAEHDSPISTSEDDGAFHIVGTGETLRQICEVYSLDLKKVAKINRIAPSHTLKTGDTIFLPAQALLVDNEGSHKPAPTKQAHVADWAAPATAKQPVSVVANAIRGHRDPAVPELKFPVPNGVLTSPFGHRWGKFHKGLDIAAPLNTPVLSCAEGKVVFTGSRKRFRRYGNTVLIAHGKGSYTYYAHLNEILVKKNQKVRKGQKIGLVGNTGRSTGPHLHLEVRVATNVYNPLAYFAAPELVKTRLAKRFADSPMGPVRAHWDIPDLLTDRR